VDRRRRALITSAVTGALAAGALAACAHPSPMRVVARGTLAYAAAWSGERLVTVELAERFELVVRDGAQLSREVGRLDLGPPELDLRALAVAGDVALVGGDDGWVRRIALPDASSTHASRRPDLRELDRWPQGAAITAIAAGAGAVAVADAEGALCVRRPSGELLQCLALDEPARVLAIDGDRVVVDGEGGTRRALALPSLAAARAPDAGPTAWRGGELARDDTAGAVAWRGPSGARTLAALAGVVRSVAASPGGKLVIAGWVKRLDQPSVIVWIDPPP
jgi:hypothetical protein